MNTEVEVNTLVNTLTDMYLSNNIDTINVIDLMKLMKIAMEYTERVSSNGEIKRNIVIRSVVTLIDRFVKDEKTKSVMKSMVPQIINTIIDVSKKRWFVNIEKRYKSCCL